MTFHYTPTWGLSSSAFLAAYTSMLSLLPSASVSPCMWMLDATWTQCIQNILQSIILNRLCGYWFQLMATTWQFHSRDGTRICSREAALAGLLAHRNISAQGTVQSRANLEVFLLFRDLSGIYLLYLSGIFDALLIPFNLWY